MRVRLATNLGSFEFDPLAPSPEGGGGPDPLAVLAPEVTVDLGTGPQSWAPYGRPKAQLAELPLWALPAALVVGALVLGVVLGRVSA